MKEIKLFDYQEDMKKRIEKALRLHRSVMVQTPTGTGKLRNTPFGSPCRGQKPPGREDVTALQCCICPTCPSPAGGSLTHFQPLALSKRARDVAGSAIAPPGVWSASGACAFVRKPTRPSLPLRKAPPLISVFSPQGRRGKPPSGAQNRYAIRLADHQRSAPGYAGWDRLGKGD